MNKGTDHAGIATQLQVEKALIAEGKSFYTHKLIKIFFSSK